MITAIIDHQAAQVPHVALEDFKPWQRRQLMDRLWPQPGSNTANVTGPHHHNMLIASRIVIFNCRYITNSDFSQSQGDQFHYASHKYTRNPLTPMRESKAAACACAARQIKTYTETIKLNKMSHVGGFRIENRPLRNVAQKR